MYAQILRQHRRQSSIKSKPTEFNFQASQIVGKVQRVSGKKWKASLEGSAQVSAQHTYIVSTLNMHVCVMYMIMSGMIEALSI